MEKVNNVLKPKNLPFPLLRIGLAFVFGYAAIASLIQPLVWAGFLPSFIVNVVDPMLALRGIAIFEIILALWLLSGKYVQCAAVLAALTLTGIILMNPHQLIVTFRDVGLLCAALALFFATD